MIQYQAQLDGIILRHRYITERRCILLVFRFQQRNDFAQFFIPRDVQIQIIVIVIKQNQASHLLEIPRLKVYACFNYRIDFRQSLGDHALLESGT